MNFFERFKDFFVGNVDAYAVLSERGWYAVKKSLTDVVLREHLEHDITIGSYCGWRDGNEEYCSWLCIDFDEHLPEYDGKAIPSYVLSGSYERMIELVRDLELRDYVDLKNMAYDYSGGGYHLWIKLVKDTLLSRAFDFGKYLEQEYHLKDEIFPKQRTLRSLGNMVKLPHSLHRRREDVHCNLFYFINNEGCIQGIGFERYEGGYSEGHRIRNNIPQFKQFMFSKRKQEQHKPIVIPKRNECFNWFLDNMKPCMKRIALNNSLTHGIGNGIGHAMNMTLADTFIYLGASDGVIHQAFITHTNYNLTKTQQMIDGVRSNFHPNHARISCKKIEERGFCIKCWIK